MSVEIEPSELSFQRPFTKEVSEILRLRNPNSTAVAFKVKTTAPKHYCVRPNSGRIEAGQAVEVTVLLQAMKSQPEAKCKDKFLVQSTLIHPEFDLNGGIPAVFETAAKNEIQEKKIKVVYLDAPSSEGASSLAPAATPKRDTASAGNLDDAYTPDISRTYDSPTSADADLSSAPPAYESDTKRDVPQAETAAAKVKKVVELTYEELKAKLEKAEAELASLNIAGGLRQRITKAAEVDKSPSQLATAVRQQAPEGVPVQIVAALCFASFLLAYLFF